MSGSPPLVVLDDPVVVERGGGAGEGDDVLRDAAGFGRLAAVVLEGPGTRLRVAARVRTLVVTAPAGGERDAETDGTADGEHAATAEGRMKGVAHVDVRFRARRGPADG